MKKRVRQEEDLDFRENVINSRCPITGDEFNATELTQDQVRMYRGQVIGFCSADCISEWDELSDEEKEDRLGESMEE